METYTLNDLLELKNHSGNSNPSIWVKSNLEKNSNKSIIPSNIFIDNDGDIIIEISIDYLFK